MTSRAKNATTVSQCVTRTVTAWRRSLLLEARGNGWHARSVAPANLFCDSGGIAQAALRAVRGSLASCLIVANPCPYAAATLDAEGIASIRARSGGSGRNHPANRHDCGIDSSAQPQSRQTQTSGEGVTGGWLIVRDELRYNRISAGTTDTDPDWHFGQSILKPRGTSTSETST